MSSVRQSPEMETPPASSATDQGPSGTTHNRPRATKVAQSALYGNVPQELASIPHFVGWSFEPSKKDASRLTKVPKIATARGKLRNASSTNSKAWRPFNQAIAAYIAQDDLSGIGIVMTQDMGVTFVDLDHCVDPDTGELTPTAQAIVDTFDSYTEYSPSGTGVHIFVNAVMPDAGGKVQKGRKVGDYEAYSTERFATLTGNHVDGTPATINDRQSELDGFIAQYLPEPAPSAKATTTRPTATPTLDDRRVLELADKAANRDKFRALWNGGRWDKPSDSEADLALCCELRFYVGDDAARIDGLYRQSGRNMDKWDDRRGGQTYGELTIAKAISYGGDTYDPARGRVVSIQSRRPVLADEDDRDAGGDPPFAGRAATGAPGGDNRPTIIAKNRLLDEMTREALQALYAANRGEPFIFRRNKTLARVRRDEHGQPHIEELTSKTLRTILADVAKFGYYKSAGKDEEGNALAEVVDMTPPDDLVDGVLAQADWELPALDGLIEAPALRPDGTIIDRPGYDAATRLVYIPSAGFQLAPVPNHPTEADIHAALETVNAILADFPYDGAASKAHAVALLLTGVARPAIAGKIPLALATAPAAGTGKGLLVGLAPLIATGREAKVMTAPTTEEEWGKVITSTLMTGPAFILIDDVQGKLGGGKLQAALTADIWEDRVLGANKMATLKQRAVWMATGNNLQLAGDMPRRCYRIRLDAEMARPERRKDFTIKEPLPAYVKAHRGAILGALLTIARAWYADGKPDYQVTTMGSFEAWAHTIGCMLAHAGVTGFLSNLDQMYEEADTERPQWAGFFAAWHDTYGATAVTANHVASAIVAAAEGGASGDSDLLQSLPEALAGDMTKVGALTRRLGYSLRKYERVRYELEDGAQVWAQRNGEDKHSKTAMWSVIRTPAPTNGGKQPDAQKHHPQAPAQAISGATETVRVIAGDVSNPITETSENKYVRDARVHIEKSGEYHPPSPAPIAPAQAGSGLKPAGDTFVAERARMTASERSQRARCAHPAHAVHHLASGKVICGLCGTTLEDGGVA